MSLRLTVFEIYSSKVEKLPISRKFNLWPPKTVSKFDLESKTHYQSRELVESNPLIFPLSSTTLSFETPGGRTNPPPHTDEGGEIQKTGEG